MVSIEIVSFCRISLWNFHYRNHVHSITLMSFQIISQNLVQYKAWLDDVQRLRTVTSLDVSAVAGHHAMPAALLFHLNFVYIYNIKERQVIYDQDLPLEYRLGTPRILCIHLTREWKQGLTSSCSSQRMQSLQCMFDVDQDPESFSNGLSIGWKSSTQFQHQTP